MALGDMFLKIDGTRSGPVKGESNDAAHGGEIDVLSWSWGMRAGSAMSGGGNAAKTSLDALMVTKRVDAASTALMSVMRSNELLKKAVLTVRKSGNNPIEYLVITLENARITSYDVATNPETPYLLDEKISFSFEKISVDYYPQDDKGARKGGSNFTAQTN
ncbi:Hcp family type VI secretion system effector [Aquabacterium sp.]|uniref:Hcp family type VI secretion system effector n=1 Tax=Aquabacterium sp. TaxID=1872578 RepID=UPI0035B13B12